MLETPSGNLSQIMRHINGAYTTYFNVKRDRSGHLFQGRYKAILVDIDEYAKALSRYIHLNPVRAKIVETPEEYDWSSYKFYIGKQEPAKWLYRDFILGYFGKVELVFTKDKALSRNVKMYLCQRNTGKKLKEIGLHFGIGESGVSQSCRRVAQKIEKDKKLKKKIDRLEKQINMSRMKT